MKLLELYQVKNGFRYNLDSLMLFYFASLFNPKGSLVDVGCGNGVIGLLLKRDFNITLNGVDKNCKAIEVAKKNAIHNHLEGEFFCGDIKNIKLNQKFDIFIANPPFYHSRQKSNNLAVSMAKNEEFMPFAKLLDFVNFHIKNKGVFYFCYETKSLQKIIALMELKKFFINHMQFIYSGKNRFSRLVMLEIRKYQKNELKVLQPLVVDDVFLQKLKEITKTKSIDG